MPDTNYHAAIDVIDRWEKEFPQTFEQFKNSIDIPVTKFKSELENYNIETYKQFENVYPALTAGSTFNPFLGFDVVELYESVVKEIKKKGYTGIYVIYDEFSKYLEANIREASVSDTKMLQDFAEKCNRSANNQMHIMLISHKEISNYIDTLPKAKVDGWRGISERFKHVHLSNNFNQVYDVISTVIQKGKGWNNYVKKYAERFEDLEKRFNTHEVFNDLDEGGIEKVVKNCFPLHPVSTFILPRLSERIAQNERTLFTFLSADGASTLSAFLRDFDDEKFDLVTPDLIYDYFEELFMRDVYSTDQHQMYLLSAKILSKLEEGSLEAKLVKTLTLIYILGQLDKCKPTADELMDIYSDHYSKDEITNAIKDLIENEYVVYLTRSNGYLKLKESSGVNVKEKIQDYIEKNRRQLTVKDSLNRLNNEKVVYPYRYNDEKEMTRFFDFKFIESSEVIDGIDWDVKSEDVIADGIIYAILPSQNDDIKELQRKLVESSKDFNRYVFVMPKNFNEIESSIRELDAARTLRDDAKNDKVLYAEYDVIVDDLQLIINKYINKYTHPENYEAIYIHNGELVNIHRKPDLTSLISDICDEEYNLTPIVINEALNRNDITSIADKSRRKILVSLLQSGLSENLGFTGHGQEVTMMRSVLVNTGVLVNDEDNATASLNMYPSDENLENVLFEITNFLKSAKGTSMPFDHLYNKLTLPEYHIGMRRGLIPIYLAAVIHGMKNEIIVSDGDNQIPMSADLLMQINAVPRDYTVSYFNFDSEKEEYVQRLSSAFADHIVESEKNGDTYEYLAKAMRRWYMALPKYSKECKVMVDGTKIEKRNSAFIKLLKGNVGNQKLIFEHLPMLFGTEAKYDETVTDSIEEIREFYDNLLINLKKYLSEQVKDLFKLESNEHLLESMSLTSVVKDWCESLDQKVFNQLFEDNTEKYLKLFNNITNDENLFITDVAKLATGLRVDDWTEVYVKHFVEALKKFKKTAEEFNGSTVETKEVETGGSGNYQLTFLDENNQPVTRSFEKVETSRRARLLKNNVQSALDSMGQSMNDQEKRQVLMEILMKLC